MKSNFLLCFLFQHYGCIQALVTAPGFAWGKNDLSNGKSDNRGAISINTSPQLVLTGRRPQGLGSRWFTNSQECSLCLWRSRQHFELTIVVIVSYSSNSNEEWEGRTHLCSRRGKGQTAQTTSFSTASSLYCPGKTPERQGNSYSTNQREWFETWMHFCISWSKTCPWKCS